MLLSKREVKYRPQLFEYGDDIIVSFRNDTAADGVGRREELHVCGGLHHPQQEVPGARRQGQRYSRAFLILDFPKNR